MPGVGAAGGEPPRASLTLCVESENVALCVAKMEAARAVAVEVDQEAPTPMEEEDEAVRRVRLRRKRESASDEERADLEPLVEAKVADAVASAVAPLSVRPDPC